MHEALFARVKPEVVPAWGLAMINAAELEKIFDLGAMDPVFVGRLREAAADMNGSWHAPFPMDVRVAIYEHYIETVRRLGPATPLAVRSGDPEAWDRFGHRLSMPLGHLLCCCGGLSLPGGGRGEVA